MTKIVLEVYPNGDYQYIDDIEFKTNLSTEGKTFLQHVLDDISAGTDKTGHAKYRKILEHHGVLKPLDLANWRASHPCVEKELPTIP